ncbi:MAG: NFACT RNA binding domain-containing protein [bacterium]
MLNNYFTIREVAEYLNRNISGYIINEIYTQEKNKLLIELINHETKTEKILEYSVERGFNYLLLKDNFTKAKKNYVNLLEDSSGEKIIRVGLYNEDRAIKFEMSNDKQLIFTFFSNKANAFLTDISIITDSFKDRADHINKNIQEVILPKNTNQIIYNEKDPVDAYVKKNHKLYGDLYMKEVIYRCKILKEEIIDEIKSEKIEKEFQLTHKELDYPKFILYSKNTEPIISLIALRHLKDYESREFENVHSLIAEYLKLRYRHDKTETLKHSRIKELTKKIGNAEQKISGLKIQLIHCSDSENLRIIGDAILQNIYKINRGDKKFSHLQDTGEEIEIKLKENLSPAENAQNYFEKYKKQKKSVSILKDKIIFMNKEKAKLESDLEKIKDMNEYKILLKEEKKSELNKNDETSRFRKFSLNSKYEVWVGKDSASNDLLTTKYAAQNDLWFHVRGAGGSHTVLKVSNKKEDVPKEVIHSAASIAAYYSKARNASTVPVAYCEKKYVKKKKGFKQGSVVMEREKVIFVKPVLPVVK